MGHTSPIARRDEGGSEVKINLRARKQDRDLIDSAAAVARKSRTEFMLDSARQAAVDALLDQRLFALGQREWDEFCAALDAPPRDNPRLRALMRRTFQWDE